MRIGADPELFLKRGNKYISSIGLIGGTKYAPFLIREDGCAVQEDNVAVEFNIPPCVDVEAFVESINFNLKYLADLAEKQGLSLSLTASAVFDKDQLANPAAQEFGCEPDYNCWTGMQNPRPEAKNKNLRSAGGHVHVGCREAKIDPWEMMKACDLFLGVPSLEMDQDTRRRELYGKAGACRIKPYGAEYRTLSNWWLQDDDSKKWVFRQVHKAKDWLLKGNTLTEQAGHMIQECINTSNMDMMKEIRRHYGV